MATTYINYDNTISGAKADDTTEHERTFYVTRYFRGKPRRFYFTPTVEYYERNLEMYDKCLYEIQSLQADVELHRSERLYDARFYESRKLCKCWHRKFILYADIRSRIEEYWYTLPQPPPGAESYVATGKGVMKPQGGLAEMFGIKPDEDMIKVMKSDEFQNVIDNVFSKIRDSVDKKISPVISKSETTVDAARNGLDDLIKNLKSNADMSRKALEEALEETKAAFLPPKDTVSITERISTITGTIALILLCGFITDCMIQNAKLRKWILGGAALLSGLALIFSGPLTKVYKRIIGFFRGVWHNMFGSSSKEGKKTNKSSSHKDKKEDEDSGMPEPSAPEYDSGVEESKDGGDEDPPMRPQAGGYFETSSQTIISILLSIFLKVGEGTKGFKKVFSIITNSAKIGNTVKWCWSGVVSLINGFFDVFSDYISKPNWFTQLSSYPHLVAFDSQMNQIVEDIALGKATLTSQTTELVKKVRDEATQAFRAADGRDPEKPFIRTVQAKAEKLLERCLRASRPSDVRSECMGIALIGGPGVGKTMAGQLLAEEFAVKSMVNRSDLEEFEKDPSSYIYSYNAHLKHWDAYRGQKVMMADDMFAVKDRDVGVQMAEFLHILNSQPMILQMADLSEKGRYLQTNVVFLTTNLDQIKENDFKEVTDIGAFVRRFESQHGGAFLCCIKEEFASNPTAPPSERRMRPDIKFSGEGDGRTFQEVQEWYPYNWLTGTIITTDDVAGGIPKGLSYDELTTMLVEKRQHLDMITKIGQTTRATRRMTNIKARYKELGMKMKPQGGANILNRNLQKLRAILLEEGSCVTQAYALVENHSQCDYVLHSLLGLIGQDALVHETLILLREKKRKHQLVPGAPPITWGDNFWQAWKRFKTWTKDSFLFLGQFATYKSLGIMSATILGFGALIAGGYYLYDNFIRDRISNSEGFFAPLEAQSGQFNRAPPKQTRRNRAKSNRIKQLRQKRVMMPQGGIDIHTAAKIHDAIVRFEYADYPGVVVNHATYLGGRTMVSPLHFFQFLNEKSSYNIYWGSHKRHMTGSELLEHVYSDPERDRAYITGIFKAEASSLKKHLMEPGSVLKFLETGKGCFVSSSAMVKGRMQCHTNPIVAKVSKRTYHTNEGHTEDRLISKDLFAYNMPGYEGACGSPILGTVNGKTVLLGIHTAGDSVKESLAQVIDMQDFELVEDEKCRLLPGIMKSQGGLSFVPFKKEEDMIRDRDYRMASEIGSVIMKSDKSVNTPFASSVIWSDLEDPMECRDQWVASSMTPKAMHNKLLKIPNRTLHSIPRPLVEDIKVFVLKKLFSEGHKVERGRPLTFREAVEGVIRGPEGEVVEKIAELLPRKKSVGYPQKWYQPPEVGNKTYFMGEEGDVDFTAPQMLEVEQRYNDLKKAILNGDDIVQIAVPMPKDEVLPIRKKGQVRVFYVSDVVFNILLKAYYGEAMSRINHVDRRIINFSTVGINPHKEWQVLGEHLDGGAGVLGFDYSSMDINCTPQQIRYAYEVLGALYPSPTKEDQAIREYCIRQLSYPVILYRKHLVQLEGVNLSGVATTVHVNGLINVLYIMSALACHYGDGESEIITYSRGDICMDSMMEGYYIATFGDDVNIRMPVGSDLESGDIAAALAMFGVKITNGDKTNCIEHSRKPVAVTACEFLHRGFKIHHNSLCLAPLDLGSISKSLNFTKLGTDRSDFHQVLDNASCELAVCGEEIWNKYMPLIHQQAMEYYDYFPRYSSFKQAFNASFDLEGFHV